MKSSMRHVFAVTAFVAACCPPALAAGGTVFSDGTFNTADWSIVDYSSAQFSHSTSQDPAGGNPGAARRQTMSLVTFGPGTFDFFTVHLLTFATYDPSFSGAIAGLAFQFDVLNLVMTNLGGTPGGFFYRPVLRQGGQDFSPVITPPRSTRPWSTLPFTANLASDWDLVGTATGAPDFGATGLPMTFGYRAQVSMTCSGVNGCTTATIIDALDNYQVTIQSAVPEPSSFLLCLAGAAALGWRRRFASRRS